MYVCICHAVTAADVRAAVEDGGARTAEAVAEATGASTGCGTCEDRLCALVGLLAADADRAADDLVASGSAA